MSTLDESIDQLYHEYLTDALDLIFDLDGSHEDFISTEEIEIYRVVGEGFRVVNNNGCDIYHNFYEFKDGIAKVQTKDLKYNFIDTSGKKISTIDFDFVYDFDEDYAIVCKDHNYNFINKNGNLIFPEWFLDVRTFSEGCAAVKKDACEGFYFIDESLKLISQDTYDDVENYHCGFAGVCKDSRWNVIDKNGNYVLPEWVEDVNVFSEKALFVVKNGKWCLVDYALNSISEDLYDDCCIVSSNIAIVTKAKKKNLIDNNGKELLPEWADDYHLSFQNENCVLSMKIGNKIYLFNEDGMIKIISCECDEIGSFYNGIAKIKRNSVFNYINLDGVVMFPEWFYSATDFCGAFAEIIRRKGDSPIVINRCFEDVTPPKCFGLMSSNNNGYMLIRYDEYANMAYADENGNIYDTIGIFGNTLVKAKRKDGKFNLADRDHNFVCDEWYDEIESFYCGFAIVQKNRQYNYIDRTGKVISDLWFDAALNFSENGIAKVLIGDKYNYIDKNGTIIFKKWRSSNGDEKIVHCGSFIQDGELIGCINIDSECEKIRKNFFGKYCYDNGVDKFYSSYRPIKKYGEAFYLCFDGKKVYLLNRLVKTFTEIGDAINVTYDDYFIKCDGKVIFIYGSSAVDITDYYNSHNLNVKGLKVNSNRGPILTKTEFFGCNTVDINRLREELDAEKRRIRAHNELERMRLEVISGDNENLKQAESQLLEMGVKEDVEARICREIEDLLDMLALAQCDVNITKRVKISELFEDDNGCRRIKDRYLKILKLIDLSNVSFENVDIRDVDFSDTNICFGVCRLDPKTVYNKDLSGCNFTGVDIPLGFNFNGVNVSGAKFSGVIMPNYDIDKVDEKTLFNGEPVVKAKKRG